jgi:hypothetical protein
MPKYKARTTIEIEVEINAKDETSASEKADLIELELAIKSNPKIPKDRIYVSCWEEIPQWEITKDE